MMMKAQARPALLAGRWYPETTHACEQFFARVPTLSCSPPQHVVAAIVPHAGWVYSGAIAYRALATLKSQVPDAELVLIFGGHLAPRHAPRLFIGPAWATPFGSINSAFELAHDISTAVTCDHENAEEFCDDNATEVQMPMIKSLWPDADLLVLGIPPNERAASLGRDVLRLAQGRGYEKIVVVGSTDMTHYGPNYDFQTQGRGHAGLAWVKSENDPLLIEQIEAMDTQKVIRIAERHKNACCPGAISATIAASRDLGASRAGLTQYTTSYDVRPDGQPTSFVGYAGFLLGR
jgi:MEMO1 family protein